MPWFVEPAFSPGLYSAELKNGFLWRTGRRHDFAQRTAARDHLPEVTAVRRGQNVAIGLTGLPDVPAKRTGATARWKSHWPSSAAIVAHPSKSQLSSNHRPIATR